MAVDYEVACRESDLAALLSAAFLLKEGARILLLPPLEESLPAPDFIIPVVRGYPATLLSDFVDIKIPESSFFSWQKGSEIENWPVVTGSDGNFSESGITGSNLRPELWEQLEKIWQLIDGCMSQNLDMPATSMRGFWHMFQLLVRSELLRESRRYTLPLWLKENDITFAEQCKWFSLVPLFSLYRFKQLPLLAFAYGVQSLLKPAALIDTGTLKRKLLEYLLANGAHRTTENWSPVFDGKWFIGVGYNNMVACRSTVYLADSNPDRLRREIPEGNQRHDFKRQLLLDDPGLQHSQSLLKRDSCLGKEHSLYHLHCSNSTELSGTEFFTPALNSGVDCRGGDALVRHLWREMEPGKRDGKKNIEIGDAWGWQPHLPAMMGAGFLPLTGSFCRFYRVGWHNLPGFGFGGMVYSAHQTALSVLKNELK